MKKLPWILVCSVVAAACSDITAPPQPSSVTPRIAGVPRNTRCVGALPPGTYNDITVPEGETCVVENSIVLGTVRAKEASRLTLFNVRVDENVLGLQAAAVHVYGGGSVTGNIDLRGANSPNELFSVFINQTEVKWGSILVLNNNAGGIGVINNSVLEGSVIIRNNNAAIFNTIQDNRIAQFLFVMDNVGPGPKAVNNNYLSVGKVSCSGNEAPFVGGPNFAASSEGQCF